MVAAAAAAAAASCANSNADQAPLAADKEAHYRYVVVGDGLAARSAVRELVSLDPEGSILLVAEVSALSTHALVGPCMCVAVE